MSFQILTVCTGNICRSPAAQLLLQNHLDQSVTVDSAGTYAMRGYPIHEPMATLLKTKGVTETTFQASQLNNARINNADILLTATHKHKKWILQESPSALKKAFTLKEFAALATKATPIENRHLLNDAEKMEILFNQIKKLRNQVDPRDPRFEIVDPYLQPVEIYESTLKEIEEAIDEILTIIH